jgi:hypothetical protein
MNHDTAYRADIADFQRQAETLLSALKSGDNDAAWRVKWEHPASAARPSTP